MCYDCHKSCEDYSRKIGVFFFFLIFIIPDAVPDVLENLLTRDGGEEGETIKEAVGLISGFVGGEEGEGEGGKMEEAAELISNFVGGEEGEGEGGKVEEAAELISSFVGGGDGEEKEEGGAAVELISDFLGGDDEKKEEGGAAVELISDFLGGDDDKEKEEKEEEEEESFFEKVAENKEAQDMALGAAANLASSFF